jgi:tetratricopeptide (TPR) repeat protein
LNVDIFGLKKANNDKLIAPLGSVPFSIAPNDVLDAYVVIQNKAIGHSLIPEVRDLYEAWVEFIVKDARGKDIYHSGFLKPDGSLDERAHSFTNRPVDKDGEFVDNHQVQVIHSVAYDNTIASGRSTIVRYQFRVPSSVRGPITIAAKINYRHLRQSYLNNVLGKGHPAYPVVQLAARSRTLNIGENQPEKPDVNDNPDWMRWNNLGIGYLDALQYSSAVQAFGEVVKLRPGYADSYTNIAVTEISWEKYGSAWDNIQKALSQYPQSRDALRDLGITYYRQGDYHEAITQFEALQAIDPDDLSAHYNLSILYHRMGMVNKAKEQQALFVTEKINSNARTYSLGYLRSHPEISIESIPWHLHTDLTDIPNGSNQTAQR